MSIRKDEDYVRIGVLGANQTGKTSTLLKTLKSTHDLKKQKILFYIEGEPQALKNVHRISSKEELAHWKHGIAKYFDYNNDVQGLKDLVELANNGLLKNGSVIFDDCFNYLQYSPTAEIKKFLGNHRFYHLDLYFVAHSFSQMPLYIRRRLENFLLFKVNEILKTPKELSALDYANAIQLHDAYCRVMKHKNQYHSEFVVSKNLFHDFDKLMNS